MKHQVPAHSSYPRWRKSGGYEMYFEMELSLASSRVKGSKNGVAEQGHVINTRDPVLNTTLVKWQITICATEQHLNSGHLASPNLPKSLHFVLLHSGHFICLIPLHSIQGIVHYFCKAIDNNKDGVVWWAFPVTKSINRSFYLYVRIDRLS